MGICSSRPPGAEDPEAARKDKEIAKQMAKDKVVQDEEIKLLLLGAGESGKSTIFKQMKIIHRDGLQPAECLKYRGAIFGNTLTSIRVLIQGAARFELDLDSDENRARAARLLSIQEQQIILKPEETLTAEIGRDIAALWADRGIQGAFGKKNDLQLNDSADYFLNDVLRISNPDYKPTRQDVLRSRVKTVGIVEDDFVIDNYKFKIVDVGGQRNERRKWIHVFDSVSAIVFVTALSEYDQRLYEDDTMNRMKESLNLFSEIANSPHFKSTSIIIFFNKEDIFLKKIQQVDLTVAFSDYTHGHDATKAKQFILNKFLALNKNHRRQIFHHFTCATNTDNIKVVFNAVKNIILHQNLADANLV